MGGFAFVGVLLTPENTSKFVSAFYPALGAAIGAVVGFSMIYLVMLLVAPYKQRNEARGMVTRCRQDMKRLTEKRLSISLPESRYDYLDNQWIRLQVQNPTTIPIPECYGKLISYRLASHEVKEDGIVKEVAVSPEAGSRTSAQFGELPLQRHMFPWSPIDLPEISVTIPGHNGYEFLYIAAKRKGQTCFYTPTDMGLKYPNHDLGNFEVQFEIGSSSEAFKPTRVKLTFSAGADLEAKAFESLLE